MSKLKLWHKCVIAFVLIHWAVFLVTYFILQRDMDVPGVVIGVLQALLIPFILVSLAMNHLPFASGSAVERAVAIIVPTVFYAIIGLIVGLVIERMRKKAVKKVME